MQRNTYHEISNGELYQSVFKNHLSLSEREILYGVLKSFSYCLNLNRLIFIGKYFLYCKAVNNAKPLFEDFVTLVAEKIEIERYIVFMSNKRNAFLEKWSGFEELWNCSFLSFVQITLCLYVVKKKRLAMLETTTKQLRYIAYRCEVPSEKKKTNLHSFPGLAIYPLLHYNREFEFGAQNLAFHHIKGRHYFVCFCFKMTTCPKA